MALSLRWVLALLLLVAVAPQLTTAQVAPPAESDAWSPLLKTNESWWRTFNEVGTARYHCMPHDDRMQAEVVVSAEDPRAREAVNVTIEDYRFEPATVYVKPGGRVTWTNRGEVEHDVMFVGFDAGEHHHGDSAIPAPPLVAAFVAVGLAAVALSAVRRR
ncbi:MAG TPA: hypothetical protein VNZ52_03365 [Candidatus Thermoplasmatota archaeon]|nr:hypothetical protein [Candidatus Thermoplasmatota archaeon]